MVEYRGYLLYRTLAPLGATDRIKRPDGTWRHSPPTLLGDGWRWIIAQRDAEGTLREVDVAATEEAARQRVDELLAPSN